MKKKKKKTKILILILSGSYYYYYLLTNYINLSDLLIYLFIRKSNTREGGKKERKKEPSLAGVLGTSEITFLACELRWVGGGRGG